MKIIAIIMILAAVGQYFLAWWALPLVAFLVVVTLASSWKQALWHTLAAGLILWGGISFWLYISHEGAYFQQVAGLIGLPSGWLLAVVTTILGGILALVSGAAGYSLRTLKTSNVR